MERDGGAAEALDGSALIRLRELGGDQFLGEMIDLFLSHVPQRIEAAVAAERSGDYLAVARAGHSLKSSAANLGVTAIRSLAVEIEQQAQLREQERVRPLLHDLEGAFERARVHLEQVKRTLGAALVSN